MSLLGINLPDFRIKSNDIFHQTRPVQVQPLRRVTRSKIRHWKVPRFRGIHHRKIQPSLLGRWTHRKRYRAGKRSQGKDGRHRCWCGDCVSHEKSSENMPHYIWGPQIEGESCCWTCLQINHGIFKRHRLKNTIIYVALPIIRLQQRQRQRSMVRQYSFLPWRSPKYSQKIRRFGRERKKRKGCWRDDEYDERKLVRKKKTSQRCIKGREIKVKTHCWFQRAVQSAGRVFQEIQ